MKTEYTLVNTQNAGYNELKKQLYVYVYNQRGVKPMLQSNNTEALLQNNLISWAEMLHRIDA